MMEVEKTDRTGYDEHYKGTVSGLSTCNDRESYRDAYESQRIGPYSSSGVTKGYVRGLAIERLVAHATSSNVPRSGITILDAGSGQGELSVYLACLGFRVIGVDISPEGRASAERLASSVGVQDNCSFLAESLEQTSIPDSSIDYVIGHASLHHFIKYEGVPAEFLRVMKPGARGYFADAWGENRMFHLFHNKEKMARLGDVSMTKPMVEAYFEQFDVSLVPTDWFVMFDKLYLKVLPAGGTRFVRRLSRVHHWLDRKMPATSRTALRMSGSVLTEIVRPS